ncbi:hypothetical protein [Nonomuraea longispora]|uniref:hypothetical protein n=1 Tax=Nonomuraea longispora TaxID=1848320 RepID=UPI0014042D01|nr:hypothetical protein [Nonomuraea longispora]
MQDTSLPPAKEETSRLVKLPEFSDIKLGSQDRYETMVLLPENWTVTKQSHKADSKVKVGTTIVLTCTKAS